MKSIGASALLFVVGCATSTAPPQPVANTPAAPTGALGSTDRLAIGSGDYGTAHPTVLRAHDGVDQRWMALCQARVDTDGDNKVEVRYGHHGDAMGDDMALFFMIGGGPGTPIDHLAGQSKDDRWVAILRAGKLELVDVTTGALWVMRDADVASDHRPGMVHRAARFFDGSLLFIRHRPAGDALVVHDLTSHSERELPVKDRVWRIADAGRVAHIFTIPRDQKFPQLRTTLAEGECLGPVMSSSTHGQDGPEPTERWIELAGGVEIKKPRSKDAESDAAAPRFSPQLAGENLGPARWSKP